MEQPPKMTRQEQAQQTRKRLFEAAYSLLEEKEFKNISISDIVSRAKVSTGTFYLYFSSKLDVYYQTYVLADAYFLETVAPLTERGNTRERLLTFFWHYANYNSNISSIKLTKLLYNGENACFLRKEPGMPTILLQIVRCGLAKGELDPAMGENEICDLLMFACRGLVYDWCISNGAYDLCEATVTYMSRIFKAVLKE